MAEDGHETADKNIGRWKIKELLRAVESEVWKEGTEKISHFIHRRNQISEIDGRLRDEYMNGLNMEVSWGRVNRRSFLGAISSARKMLKRYNEVPRNGLILYSGTIVTADGKEKTVTIDFVPFKPVNTTRYHCGNRFDTRLLKELLEPDDELGFIIMDRKGTLIGIRRGNRQSVLCKFPSVLPKKLGRVEEFDSHVRETAEAATGYFIDPNTSRPNVAGLILAGTDDSCITEVSQSEMLDSRLRANILKVVDVSDGGVDGFNHAIERSWDVGFIQEKRFVEGYLEEVYQQTGKCVFGVDDTLKALEMGAVETLIVWEDLKMNRYVLKNGISGEIIVKHLNKDEEADESNFRDSSSDAELEVQHKSYLLGWFADQYKRLGCTLKFVTNKSQEGLLFCQGFGGIGGILRYHLDIISGDGGIYEDSHQQSNNHLMDLVPVTEMLTSPPVP